MPPRPPKQPQRQGPAPQTSGPIHKVPCPHCGYENDFRELQMLGGETQIYAGAEISCDACDMMSTVSAVRPVIIIALRPQNKRAPSTSPAPRSMIPPGARRLPPGR